MKQRSRSHNVKTINDAANPLRKGINGFYLSISEEWQRISLPRVLFVANNSAKNHARGDVQTALRGEQQRNAFSVVGRMSFTNTYSTVIVKKCKRRKGKKGKRKRKNRSSQKKVADRKKPPHQEIKVEGNNVGRPLDN